MTKEEAIKHLHTYSSTNGSGLTTQNQHEEAKKMAIKALETQLRWIPCSERLPDNNRQVLVYARSVHFALAKYDEMREADGTYKMQWVTFDAWKPFYKIKEVIAWMPLPDSWEGEEHVTSRAVLSQKPVR